MSNVVLDVERLTVSLPRGADRQHAVSDLSVQVAEGQVLCLVGESGSGKSITAHTVMGLLPSNMRATAGRIRFGGEDVLQATPRRLRQLRGEKMSIIFQEPLTALNPVMTCGAQIDEVLVEHTPMSGTLRRARVLDMLDRVRLPDPEGVYRSYPHQLSGGQRQRIMIAMALDPQASTPDRRRAHDRARRHDASRDSQADSRPAVRAPDGRAVHHARFRRGG